MRWARVWRQRSAAGIALSEVQPLLVPERLALL